MNGFHSSGLKGLAVAIPLYSVHGERREGFQAEGQVEMRRKIHFGNVHMRLCHIQAVELNAPPWKQRAKADSEDQSTAW